MNLKQQLLKYVGVPVASAYIALSGCATTKDLEKMLLRQTGNYLIVNKDRSPYEYGAIMGALKAKHYSDSELAKNADKYADNIVISPTGLVDKYMALVFGDVNGDGEFTPEVDRTYHDIVEGKFRPNFTMDGKELSETVKEELFRMRMKPFIPRQK